MARIRQLRWKNFRSFADTDTIDLLGLTIVVGANASGKTSLLAPLLLLKQTLESRDASLALKTKGRYFNAGGFSDLIFAHDARRDLDLSISWGSPAPEGASAPAKGDAPPTRLDLTFRDSGLNDAPDLTHWVARDPFGRVLLARRRNEQGSYSLEGLKLPGEDPRWNEAIRHVQPDGFLFPPESVFSAVYEEARKNPNSARTSLNVTLSPHHQFYLQVAGFVSGQVRDALDNITYVGPLRDRPRRIYEIGGEIPFSVGSAGQYAPELIYRADPELLREINSWIKRFEFGHKLLLKELSTDVFSLELARAKGSTNVNVADTGFGLSQILPLIVQGYFSDPGETLIAEQPEIHLNPRLQGVLGDLLVAIANRGVNVVLETHSEHLILRIRRLIAEGAYSADKTALYFTERDNVSSRVRRIPIDTRGAIPRGEWPRGFFEDGLTEALALASAQARMVPRAR